MIRYNSEHFNTAGRSVKTGEPSMHTDNVLLLCRDPLQSLRLLDNLDSAVDGSC